MYSLPSTWREFFEAVWDYPFNLCVLHNLDYRKHKKYRLKDYNCLHANFDKLLLNFDFSSRLQPIMVSQSQWILVCYFLHIKSWLAHYFSRLLYQRISKEYVSSLCKDCSCIFLPLYRDRIHYIHLVIRKAFQKNSGLQKLYSLVYHNFHICLSSTHNHTDFWNFKLLRRF